MSTLKTRGETAFNLFKYAGQSWPSSGSLGRRDARGGSDSWEYGLHTPRQAPRPRRPKWWMQRDFDSCSHQAQEANHGLDSVRARRSTSKHQEDASHLRYMPSRKRTLAVARASTAACVLQRLSSVGFNASNGSTTTSTAFWPATLSWFAFAMPIFFALMSYTV